jgi:hypothetical protein
VAVVLEERNTHEQRGWKAICRHENRDYPDLPRRRTAMRALRPPRGRKQWIIFIAGIVLLCFCLDHLWWGYSSTRWPRVDAVITESKAHYPLQSSVYLELRYAFDCGNKQCTGDRWRYKFFSDQPDWIYTRHRPNIVAVAAAAHPKGQHVKVAVKPGDPSESVLEPGVSGDDVTLALFGLLLVLSVTVSRRGDRRAAKSASSIGSSDVHPGPRKRSGSALTLALIGSVLMVVSIYQIYRGMAGFLWPQTHGTVVHQHWGSNHGSLSVVYFALVDYEYFVDGTRYLGETSNAGSHSYIKDWIAPLQAGAHVTVHYNPRNVSDSEIEIGISWRHILLPAFAMLFFGIAWLLQKVAEKSNSISAVRVGAYRPPTENVVRHITQHK